MGTSTSKVCYNNVTSALHITINGQDVPEGFGAVKFESNSFAAGVSRMAYRGEIASNGAITLGDGQTIGDRIWNFWTRGPTGYPCVVKLFKHSYAHHVADWNQDTRILVEADSLAVSFNQQVRANKKIRFATAFITTVTERGREDVFEKAPCKKRRRVGSVQSRPLIGEYVCIEPFLSGNFIKINSNSGWVNTSMQSKLGNAFCHFTYHFTGGQKLYCDLQGVKDDNVYRMTDPAVHSLGDGGRFGPTDLGTRGIHAFFRTHTCNEFCSRYIRPVIRDPNLQMRQNTTYTFEI